MGSDGAVVGRDCSRKFASGIGAHVRRTAGAVGTAYATSGRDPGAVAADLQGVERASLLAICRVHKVNPGSEQLEAALKAVKCAQQECGVASTG